MMRQDVCVAMLAAVWSTLPGAISAQPAPSPPPATPILGFSPAHALAEHRLEERFQSLPSAEAARSWHREFTPCAASGGVHSK